jgi:hypothetical protein
MQALFTMHEILVAFEGSPLVKQIVLDSDPKMCNSPQAHVIKIKCDLDDNSYKIINSVIEKRNLKIERVEDTLIIH